MAVCSASWLLQMAQGDMGTREQEALFASTRGERGKVTEVYDQPCRCVYIREPVVFSKQHRAESMGLVLYKCHVSR